MFKIIDTNGNILNELLLLAQYFLWIRLIDQVARGVAPAREYTILGQRLRYFWFGGNERGTCSRNSYDYLIQWAYLFYGHTWHPYGAVHNLTAIYREHCGDDKYGIWLEESGYRSLGSIIIPHYPCNRHKGLRRKLLTNLEVYVSDGWIYKPDLSSENAKRLLRKLETI